jgi:hypothetical protein
VQPPLVQRRRPSPRDAVDARPPTATGAPEPVIARTGAGAGGGDGEVPALGGEPSVEAPTPAPSPPGLSGAGAPVLREVAGVDVPIAGGASIAALVGRDHHPVAPAAGPAPAAAPPVVARRSATAPGSGPAPAVGGRSAPPPDAGAPPVEGPRLPSADPAPAIGVPVLGAAAPAPGGRPAGNLAPEAATHAAGVGTRPAPADTPLAPRRPLDAPLLAQRRRLDAPLLAQRRRLDAPPTAAGGPAVPIPAAVPGLAAAGGAAAPRPVTVPSPSPASSGPAAPSGPATSSGPAASSGPATSSGPSAAPSGADRAPTGMPVVSRSFLAPPVADRPLLGAASPLLGPGDGTGAVGGVGDRSVPHFVVPAPPPSRSGTGTVVGDRLASHFSPAHLATPAPPPSGSGTGTVVGDRLASHFSPAHLATPPALQRLGAPTVTSPTAAPLRRSGVAPGPAAGRPAAASAAPWTDAGAVALATGLGTPGRDGAVVFDSTAGAGPATSAAGTAAVQRQADEPLAASDTPPAGAATPPVTTTTAATTTTATATAGAAPTAAAPPDLDELARQLYDRIRGQLRRELLLDRERAGYLTDARF